VRRLTSFAEALIDHLHLDSDGVDSTGNPLLVSISTNTTGTLNLIATVSPTAGSDILILIIFLQNAAFPAPFYLGGQSSIYYPNLAPGSDV
jgi:hypothetical protein